MKLSSLIDKPFDPAWIQECNYDDLIQRYLTCAKPSLELERRIIDRLKELQPKR